MRVLFVTLPERGHLNPLVGPAQEVARRGHEVAFYAPCDVSAELQRAGFGRFFGGGEPPGDENRGAALAELTRDPARLRTWVRDLLLGTVPDEVARLEAVVRDFRPKVIAADPMAYQAPIVAARARLPWAALSTSLNPVVPDDFGSELISTAAWLAPERDALFRRLGCEARFRVCDCLSADLTIAFTTEALVGAPPTGVTLAGPSLPRAPSSDSFPWPRLVSERSLIYMSLGSQNWYQPRAVNAVFDAVRGRDAQLVVAAGGLAGALSPPPNALVVPWAPQLELFARARVAITHAGANSVMEALAFGVPLLCAPFVNDQPHNARFVERAGAGRTIDLDRATPDEIGAALDALLEDGPERAAAARIGESYRARDGAQIAAERLLALA